MVGLYVSGIWGGLALVVWVVVVVAVLAGFCWLVDWLTKDVGQHGGWWPPPVRRPRRRWFRRRRRP